MITKEILAVISFVDKKGNKMIETPKVKYKLPDTPLNKLCGSVTIDNNKTDINNRNNQVTGTFGECLRTIAIHPGIIEMPYKYLHGCRELNSIELPDSIERLSDNCFSCCSELETITIPQKVTAIPLRCFSVCQKLQNIQLPSQLTSIGESAFSNCTSLKKIKLPKTLETIGESAFYGCYALQSINIPHNISSIGNRAFFQCNSLTEINIPSQFLNNTIFNFTNMPKLRNIICEGRTLISLNQHDSLKNLIRNQNLILIQYIDKDKQEVNSVVPLKTNNISSKHLTSYFNCICNHPIFKEIEDDTLKFKLCLNMISTLKKDTAIKFLNELYSKNNSDTVEITEIKTTFMDKLKTFFSKLLIKRKEENDSAENNIKQNRSGNSSKNILINLFSNVNCDTNIEEFDKFFNLNMESLINCNNTCVPNNMANIQKNFNTILQIPQISEKLNSGELTIDVLAKYLLSHSEADTDDNNGIPYSDSVSFEVTESDILNCEKEIEDR